MNNTEKANEIAEKYFFEYTYEYSEEELGTSK